MERRKSERKYVNVSVYVSLPGHPAMWCTARDISNAGIFLKTNPVYVARQKKIGLVFALRKKSSNVVRMHRVSAMVARTVANGVGMVFCGRHNQPRTPPA